ncbi:MAG: flavin monoamine oxidase family protein [Anaerolineales bacterium]
MTSLDYLSLIRHGLGQSAKPKKVLIAGAGMAGLVAAHELLRAGHEPLVLEAQQRVGGRILTLREPFAPGLYAEAGAMRIPTAHTLTLEYVQNFGLRTYPFTMSSPQAYLYFNGRKVRAAEAEADPACLGFAVAPHEHGHSAGRLWEAALKPMRQRLTAEGDAAWELLTERLDQYSVREFLEREGWSEGMIEMFGLLFNQESILNSSLMELLREELHNYYTDMVQIEGGMDQLPLSFVPGLRDRIRFDAKITAIDQSPEDVTVHYTTADGRLSVTGDYAILTLPFPVLRHIESVKPFSAAKRRAIRQLHYDASAKIFFQCRRRFWEEDDGIFGGGTLTDLPVRNIYYTEHGRETGRGVMLASYTWSEDAQRWGSLSPHDRLQQALENVAVIHPQVLGTFEVGASKMWHDDEFAGGAFALFDPGQQTLLHDAICAPEGRVHFAGEHCSLGHAWIQGAIESGLRAAHEIYHAA